MPLRAILRAALSPDAPCSHQEHTEQVQALELRPATLEALPAGCGRRGGWRNKAGKGVTGPALGKLSGPIQQLPPGGMPSSRLSACILSSYQGARRQAVVWATKSPARVT